VLVFGKHVVRTKLEIYVFVMLVFGKHVVRTKLEIYVFVVLVFGKHEHNKNVISNLVLTTCFPNTSITKT
jgi:hypothetical protein